VDNDCDGRKDEGCLAGAKTTTYTYNAFNQLLSATGPGGTTTFTYDLNGNQTQKNDPVAPTTYTWDARDRLVTVATTVPTSCPGDQDCDTVPDGIDNCPAIANPSQADSEAPVGAVALYRFEEASGATVEDSVGSNAAYCGSTLLGRHRARMAKASRCRPRIATSRCPVVCSTGVRT
jgi:YD repeat-containing protein